MTAMPASASHSSSSGSVHIGPKSPVCGRSISRWRRLGPRTKLAPTSRPPGFRTRPISATAASRVGEAVDAPVGEEEVGARRPPGAGLRPSSRRTRCPSRPRLAGPLARPAQASPARGRRRRSGRRGPARRARSAGPAPHGQSTIVAAPGRPRRPRPCSRSRRVVSPPQISRPIAPAQARPLHVGAVGGAQRRGVEVVARHRAGSLGAASRSDVIRSCSPRPLRMPRKPAARADRGRASRGSRSPARSPSSPSARTAGPRRGRST